MTEQQSAKDQTESGEAVADPASAPPPGRSRPKPPAGKPAGKARAKAKPAKAEALVSSSEAPAATAEAAAPKAPAQPERRGRFHEKRLWKPKGKKVVNLAFQGGGAHGAFTWGVCDRLLEDATFEIEGITGTSAGAMNATVLAYGHARGGSAGARAALDGFWHAIAKSARFSPYQRAPIDRLMGSWSLDNSPGYQMMDLIGRMFSPYDLNPGGRNPLREVLERHVDFAFLREHASIKVFLNAVNVRSGKLKQFSNPELSVDAVLASGCLPFMFHAVEIDGEHYWDGGYCGNPALYPLIYHCNSPDILLVQINPMYRAELPRSARQILDRVNEISFNSSLMREMRAIKFVSDLIDQGKLSEEDYVKLHVHMIASEELADFGASSKLNAELEFLLMLKELGRKAAEDWLTRHWDAVNVRSSCDLQVFL